MKQLNEYLNTRVKIKIDDFPYEPNYDDIIKFFESHHFTRVKMHPSAPFSDTFQKGIENNDGPLYFDGKMDGWGPKIWFVKNTNNRYDPKDDPIFQMYFVINGKIPVNVNLNNEAMFSEYDNKNFDSYEEFRYEVIKHFNFDTL